MGRTMVRVIGTVAAMALAAAVGWFGVVSVVEPRSSGRRASVTGTSAVPAAAASEEALVAHTPPAQVSSEPGQAASGDDTDTAKRQADGDGSEGPGARRHGGRFGTRSDQTTQ